MQEGKEKLIQYVRCLCLLMMVSVTVLSVQSLVFKNNFFTDYALLIIVMALLFITTILYMIVKEYE